MYKVHDKVVYRVSNLAKYRVGEFIDNVNNSPLLNAAGFSKLSKDRIVNNPWNSEIFLVFDEMPAPEIFNRVKALAFTNDCKIHFCPFRTLTGIIPGIEEDPLHHYSMELVYYYNTEDREKIVNKIKEIASGTETIDDLIFYVTSSQSNSCIYIDTNLERKELKDFLSGALYNELCMDSVRLKETS